MKHISTLVISTIIFTSGCGHSGGFTVNASGNLAAEVEPAQAKTDDAAKADNAAKDASAKDDDDTPDAEWDGTKHGEAWTKATSDAIDKYGDGLIKTVPDDAATWCPNFAKLDNDGRKAFWIDFISAMAQKESDLDEDMRYKEAFNDSTNTRVISRGLLQLSKESANGYGCNIDVGSELETAHTNLTCGVRILNHWVAHDGVVQGGEKGAWRGGARFWAVLRTPESKRFIRRAVLGLEICKAPKDALPKVTDT